MAIIGPSPVDTPLFSFLKLFFVLSFQSDCVSEPAQQHFVDVVDDDDLFPENVVQFVFQCIVILFYPSETVI